MTYAEDCAGISASSVAWHDLGWKCQWATEIEKFPAAVIRARHPHVNLLGDMTTVNANEHGPIDLLIAGTPCQGFSVAGFRAGLADPRSNLALAFLRHVDQARPRWLVWENVPGVYSSGDDFGAFLWGLSELGYGYAYRTLDAQYFGVPQRRRRVFVVGYFGDWRPAAAVLFERACLQGNPPPRRQTGQKVTGTISARTSGGGGLGTDFDLDNGLIARTLLGKGNSSHDSTIETYVTASTGDIAHCLNAGAMGRIDYETETMIAHTIRAEGFDASEDGTGRGIPLIYDMRGNGDGETVNCLTGDHASRPTDYTPLVFDHVGTQVQIKQDGITPTVRALNHKTSNANRSSHLSIFMPGQGAKAGSIAYSETVSPSLKAGDSGTNRTPAITHRSTVRRLTPRECERLQGFPDDYTLINYRGKPAKDGPRYKALGNSIAVPVLKWLGHRIQLVQSLIADMRSSPSPFTGKPDGVNSIF